ncbi:alpha/beta hydrolase [Actinopolyspora mortivallis]|nr:alpha/beta hydrolase family protein [Actinopolyspora mortivallis]
MRRPSRVLGVLTVLFLVLSVPFSAGGALGSAEDPWDGHAFPDWFPRDPLPGFSGGYGGNVPADNGARIAERRILGKRTMDLAIDSPSLGEHGMVRVLFPPRWQQQPWRRWPVLYLLHGCCEVADYESWTRFTDVREFTADKEVIVVMPSDGPAGMYSAWHNHGMVDIPDWETFHLTEVRQILERNFRAGERRAVAGVSIGGFGAMHYAFRHPDMFDAAASYSGMLNTMGPLIPAVVKGILIREGYYDWRALWGDDRIAPHLWRSHNPYDNVESLRGTDLYVSSGNGLSGPLDDGPGFDVLEPAALRTSESFVRKLRRRDIPVTTDFYGPGTHSWPYWERALHRSWPLLSRDFYR